jgi:hypothetical protein
MWMAAAGKVKVRAERGEEHLDAETDHVGNFSLLVRGSSEPWRVTATRGDLSATPASLVLDAGEHALTLTLRDAAPLSGHLRAPDGSPLPTVVVQALPIIEEGSVSVIPGLTAEIFNTGRLTDFPVIPETTAPTRSALIRRGFRARERQHQRGKREREDAVLCALERSLRIARRANTSSISRPMTPAGSFSTGAKSWKRSSRRYESSAPLEENEKSGAVTLEAGDHELLLEFYNDTGRDGVRLAWSFEGGKRPWFRRRFFSTSARSP